MVLINVRSETPGVLHPQARSRLVEEVQPNAQNQVRTTQFGRMSALDAVQLLKQLDAGQLLNDEHTQELMTILLSTPSGANRLRAGVPDGALVYH